MAWRVLDGKFSGTKGCSVADDFVGKSNSAVRGLQCLVFKESIVLGKLICQSQGRGKVFFFNSIQTVKGSLGSSCPYMVALLHFRPEPSLFKLEDNTRIW